MANQPKTLLIGPPNDLTEDVVYALPARQVFLHSTVALEICAGTVGGTFVALTTTTTGVVVGAGFVRCTTAAAVVRCKAA